MANAILGLLAETPIHAGASASAGVIDLPVQREAHTNWPCVFGSGVKGALRTRAEEGNSIPGWVDEVFGPTTQAREEDKQHAGALAVGDARLLLLPVRSLTSHFKWVTCPDLLKRAQRDCARMGLSTPETTALDPGDGVIVPEQANGNNENKKLFLEELSFDEKPQDLIRWVEFLAGFMALDDAAAALTKQLAVVNNDNFTYLAQFATPVAAHVRIDNKKKTVERGALWYEETLPPETVLYTCLSAQESRKKGSDLGSDDVLKKVTDLYAARPYLQIGGNETVGMGWCKVKLLKLEVSHGQEEAER